MELPLKKALWSYDWDSIVIVLDTIESKISLEQEKEQKEELRLLAAYLRPLREIESCKEIREILEPWRRSGDGLHHWRQEDENPRKSINRVNTLRPGKFSGKTEVRSQKCVKEAIRKRANTR